MTNPIVNPSGAQEGANTTYTSLSMEDRVITLNGLSGTINLTSTTLTPSVSGNNIDIEINTNNANIWSATQTFATIIPSLVNLSTATNTLTGTSAGSVIWNMPYQGSGYKKAIFYLNDYENTTTTAQTITFPTAFTYTPIVTTSISGVSASTTTLTLPASMTATATGYIIVEGF